MFVGESSISDSGGNLNVVRYDYSDKKVDSGIVTKFNEDRSPDGKPTYTIISWA